MNTRPKQSTGRLENPLFDKYKGMWKPSLSYKETLYDIQNQMTPAEYYRYTLQTSGKDIRAVQSLEWKISRHQAMYSRLVLKIQKTYRGMIGRKYFKSVRDDLIMQFRIREAKQLSTEHYLNEEYDKAVNVIDSVYPLTIELMVIKLKVLYKIENFQYCIIEADKILDLDELHEETMIIKASVFAKYGDFDQSLKELNQLFDKIAYPSIEAMRLIALVSTHVKPPKFLDATQYFTRILDQIADDYETQYQRACCFSCIQDWHAALKDVEHILLFTPGEVKVRLLKARILSCLRKWKEARTEYERIIQKYSMTHPAAVEIARNTLSEFDHDYEALPMIDHDTLHEND